jgi:hypothetical protein
VPSTAHSRSAIFSQKIGCRSVSDCAAALRSLSGATTLIVPRPSSAATSARSPSAWIPSSFVIRIFGIQASEAVRSAQIGEAMRSAQSGEAMRSAQSG